MKVTEHSTRGAGRSGCLRTGGKRDRDESPKATRSRFM